MRSILLASLAVACPSKSSDTADADPVGTESVADAPSATAGESDGNAEDDGGTTDFDYYKVKVKPETGKTLIWPAEWTHAHRGSVLNGGEKYIITGWLHLTD